MKKSNKKNNNMIDNMYRYLEKFIGTYRVMAEYDLQTNDFPRDEEGNIDKSFEDLYIPCSRGKSVIKHTYDDEVLVICFYDKSSTAKNVFNELKCKYKNIYLEYDDCGTDALIYFKSEDIDKIATIVKPKTSGSSIKWSSTKNLPKVEYTIPSKDLNQFKKITEKLDRTQKMHFSKTVNSEFLKQISIGFDAKEEQKKSRLGAKEYIHSINKWGDYIEFIKDRIKTYK